MMYLGTFFQGDGSRVAANFSSSSLVLRKATEEDIVAGLTSCAIGELRAPDDAVLVGRKKPTPEWELGRSDSRIRGEGRLEALMTDCSSTNFTIIYNLFKLAVSTKTVDYTLKH